MSDYRDWMNYYLDHVIGVGTYKITLKPKANNNAPKSIKGDYDVSIHGNKIVLVDKKNGTTVEAKCHPDDNFNIGDGIKEAFKKLNEKREEIRKAKEEEDKKIKVGDWVEVTEPGESYTLFVDLFNEDKIHKYAYYYRYGVVPAKGVKGKVIFVDKYNRAVIEVVKDTAYGDEEYGKSYIDKGVYVIGVNGLRKVKKPL